MKYIIKNTAYFTMVVDFEQCLLNVMHATIQVIDVIVVIFSERFSTPVILFASLELFRNQSFKVKIWIV